LRGEINAELRGRGRNALEWEERYWDGLAVEIIAPLAAFRRAARESGLDIIDLFRPLSFEGVVYRLKDAFEDTVPMFALYARDAGWRRGGFGEEQWLVAASAWTKQWLGVSYRRRAEYLTLPRKHAPIRPGSFIDDVRRRKRPLLVHASGDVEGTPARIDVLLRPRAYGQNVAQLFAVGVESRFGHLLAPQLQLVAPEERDGTFAQLF
jgi:hypothetical protein